MATRIDGADATEPTAHALSHLLFLYADADGPCSLCKRRRHRIAACCYEVRLGSRQPLYVGIELCPGCLERAGLAGAIRVLRRLRREVAAAWADDRSEQGRRDRAETTACADAMIRLAETGRCLLPPPLPMKWLARGK